MSIRANEAVQGLPALRRLLLAMVGTATEPALDRLSQQDWIRLDSLAAQHRLQPLLHARYADTAAIPAEFRQCLRAEYRLTAITAMAQRADLIETVQLLESHGILPLALKGAWLSRHAYPDPALRPCRDLDLLVPEDAAEQAFELLIAAGYHLAQPPEMSLADTLRIEKHLPPLVAPRGTVIELHHRLWEPDGRLDHASPLADLAAIRARAWHDGDGIAYPGGADMLGHLIVHAVYGHRFDCGPLLLADIDFLLNKVTIEWPRFWANAARDGWRDGARLVLELVIHYRPSVSVILDAKPAVPAELLASAPDLLLQDLGTRKSARVLAAALKSGPAMLARRAKGERSATGALPVQRDMASEGGRLRWAWSRLQRTVGDLADGDVRRQSRQLAELSRWLDR